MQTSDKDMARVRLEIDLEGLQKTISYILKMVGKNDPLDRDYLAHLRHMFAEANDSILGYNLTHPDIKN